MSFYGGHQGGYGAPGQEGAGGGQWGQGGGQWGQPGNQGGGQWGQSGNQGGGQWGQSGNQGGGQWGQSGGGGASGGYPPSQGAWGGAQQQVDPSVMQWFQAVDRDRSGKINASELQMALTNANWSKFNLDTCKLMILMFDKNSSGQMDLDEFQGLWNYIHQWKVIFDQFDNDKSGNIDESELNHAFSQMGYKLDPNFSRAIIKRFDSTGSNKITLDSFIHSCVLIKVVTDIFRGKDIQQTGIININFQEFLNAVVLNKL